MPRLLLPSDSEDLVAALDAEMTPADQEAEAHMMSHKVVDAYLGGSRRFRAFDRLGGHLSVAFENQKGELEFRHEEIIRLYLAEVGRYLKMDISPVATRRGDSLGAMRKAAVGSAVLGALAAKLPMETLHRRVVIPFLKYGTVGLHHKSTGDSLRPDNIEVVAPDQLRGFPAWVRGTQNLYAKARKRWVPMEWAAKLVKELYRKRLPTKNVLEVLRASEVPWGSTPPGSGKYMDNGPGTGAGGVSPRRQVDAIGTNITTGRHGTSDSPRRKDGRLYVPFEEIYVLDDTGEYVSRYIVKIGGFIAYDEDLEKKGVPEVCPLQVARHTDTGMFFARGFVSPLIPMNDQVEKMLQNLFKNVQELDMFGTLFVTGGMGIDLKRWRAGKRPRVDKYEPDPLDPSIPPLRLAPTNSGKLPGDVAGMGSELLQKQAGQGPMFSGEAAGRVDSAAGLGFLFNTANIALGLPVNGIADAYAGSFQRMLQSAKERMEPGQTIELATIDDAIAGVVVNPQTGGLELARNPIPQPWEVKVDIRDRTPKNRDIQSAELKELFGMGLVDPDRFWIAAFENHLDLPGSDRMVWETWRKAKWQIVVLFGDGTTPGQVDYGEHVQVPNIQLMAVQQFMNTIEFSLATPQVRKEFEEWKMSLELLSGVFPIGMPPPEVAAMAQQGGASERPGIPGMGIPPGMAPGGPNMV